MPSRTGTAADPHGGDRAASAVDFQLEQARPAHLEALLDAHGGRVNLEGGFPETTLRALQLKRHRLGRSIAGYGGYQAIMKLPGGGWAGASESRKDGQAAGY